MLNPPVDWPLSFVSCKASPCTASISLLVSNAHASVFAFAGTAAVGAEVLTTGDDEEGAEGVATACGALAPGWDVVWLQPANC